MKNAPNAITRNKAGLAARKTYKENKKQTKIFISKAMIKKFIGIKKKKKKKTPCQVDALLFHKPTKHISSIYLLPRQIKYRNEKIAVGVLL